MYKTVMQCLARSSAAVLLLIVFAATGAAQQPLEVVGVEISPPKVEFDLDRDRFSIDVRLTNHEEEAHSVRLRVTGLGHDLDGNAAFIEPSVAADVVDLSVRRLQLGPDESREVTMVGSIPGGERALYGALVAKIERSGATPQEGEVQVTNQIASIFLLRGPKPWSQSVEVVDVSVRPIGEGDRGPYSVYAAVKATGNVHVRPTGRVNIYKSGKLVDTVLLPGDNIIPGFARRLAGTWQPNEKLSGSYQLEAEIESPNATGVGEVTFQDGVLEVTAGEIVGMVPQNKKVTVALTNSGTVGFVPSVTLIAKEGGTEVARQTFERPGLEPDATDEFDWAPELDGGLYVITAELTANDELLDQEVTGIEVKGPNLILWGAIAAGAILLLLLLWLAIRALRRRRTRRRSKPQETPAPVVTKPATVGDAAAAAQAAAAAAQAALQAAQAAQQAAAAVSASPAAAPETQVRPPGVPPPPPPPPKK